MERRQGPAKGEIEPLDHRRRREQEYFVDGMVEEIITALSRIPWLRDRPKFELHLRGSGGGHETGRQRAWLVYVLEGSVRK